MTSIIKVDTIPDTAGNNIINENSNTITIGASGDTTNIVGTLQNNGAAVGGTNTPNFHAYLNGDQTLPSDSATKINFNAESWDTASAFDSSSNYRFTVPSGQAGKYIFTATGGFSNADAGTAARYQLMFYKNNASSDFAGDFAQAQSASADPTMNFTTQFDLSAGDYIDARIYHNASSTETLQSAYARFFGYKLIGV